MMYNVFERVCRFNMENEILEQILGELKDLKQGQSKLEARLEASHSKLEDRFSKLEADMRDVKDSLEAVKASALRTELVEYPRIQAALDGIVAATEKIESHDNRINVLENKVEKHGFEIVRLKSAI